MPSDPVVSIVIPCRNQAHYLGAALDSVRRQTFTSLETIVVDDGSSDDTAAVAEAANATLIRIPHSGVSAARNRGLHMARAPYVIFLDADDELEPDAVATGVALLDGRPDAWMIARSCVLTNSNGAPLPTNCVPPDRGDLYGQWLGRNLVWTPGAVVFRRGPLLSIGGFPLAVGPAADYAVYLEFARAGRVAFEEGIAVRYRQHDSNMSRDAVQMLRATLAVLRREESVAPWRYRERLKQGRLDWCTFYGEQIIQQLRHDVRRRRFGWSHVRAVAFLIRACRGLVLTHLARKLRRLAAGHPPAEIEAGRFSPTDTPGERANARTAGSR